MRINRKTDLYFLNSCSNENTCLNKFIEKWKVRNPNFKYFYKKIKSYAFSEIKTTDKSYSKNRRIICWAPVIRGLWIAEREYFLL